MQKGSVGDRVTPTWITRRDLPLDDEEGKERSKEEIGDLEEVACTDLSGVVAQEGRPLLASWLVRANGPHVFLNSSLAGMNAQFQQLPAIPFSSPQPIVLRHLPDQDDRFCGDLRLVGRGI